VVARVRLAQAHRLAGALAGDTARSGRAERMLDGVLHARPDLPEALAVQGDFLQERDRLDAAARSYERAASLRPGDASILGRLSFTQALRSDTAALATGARAVALAPDDPDLLRRVIAATSVFRRFDQLELYSDRLIALDPGDTFGYLHKALVQIVARGDTAAALRTLAQAERVLGQTPMVVAWVYAMAGPAGWRRWHDLTLDRIASPDALDSLQYYWYQALIAAAERRPAVSRAYADSIVRPSAVTRQSRDYAFRLAMGAYGRALRGERAEGRRELAEAEALRRTMAPASQAMYQTAFIAANAELGDIDRALAGTRWLLEEPALYTRRAVRLSPEFHRLLGGRAFEQLLADTSLP
jgi:tetratricopeptide (TPR) repeat protein